MGVDLTIVIRFGGDVVTIEPNLHHRAAVDLDLAPTSLEQAASSHTNQLLLMGGCDY